VVVGVVESAPTAAASAYDAWFDSPWGRYAFEVETAAIRRGLGPLDGRRVLDVGCGTGRFTAVLEGLAGLIVGIDLDRAMLAVASARLRSPLVLADAICLPFEDAAFDVALAVTLCEFTADPRIVLAELARVTGHGGRIIVGALNPHSPWGLARRRRLRHPPWDTARFLSRRELVALGAPYGHVTLDAALFASRYGSGWFSRFRETVGRACPRFGAFQVLVIDKENS